MSIDPQAFIRQNLRLEPVPSLPDIVLYTAHPGSRLSRLATPDDAAPYWAWQWAGGLALARHFMAQPASSPPGSERWSARRRSIPMGGRRSD